MNIAFLKNHSWSIRLLVLLCIMLFLSNLGAILSINVFSLINDISVSESIALLNDKTGSGGLELTLFLLVIQSFTMFVFPAILFPILQGENVGLFFKLKNKPTFKFVLWSIVAMILSFPIAELLNQINQQMVFPEVLKDVEYWMRNKEDDLAKTTADILLMNNSYDFIRNIIVVSFLPAIGEELVFRGVVQSVLGRIFNNVHIAIWVAAIIFSAFHLQFYGFLPRMFLGAILGYLFFYGKSLWYPIIAHFFNNFFIVATSFLAQENGLPYNYLETIDYSLYIYIVDFVLIIFFYNKYFKIVFEKYK